MSTLTRRHLLASTALIPAGLLLADCSALSALAPLAPAASSAIQAIGQYLQSNFLPALSSAGASIPGSVLNTINTVVGSIEQAGSGIVTATTQTQGQSTLQTIEGFVNQLAPIVSPFLALVPGVGPILAIAFGALPAIEGLVNLGVSALSPLVNQIAAIPVPTPASARLRAAAAHRLTPAEALAQLLAATGR